MQESKYNPPASDGTQRATGKVSEGRRRLLRGGAGVAPIFLAITTRPAKASSVIACQTPSAFGSMNLSRAEDTFETCSGQGPEYWMDEQHFAQWRQPYYPSTDYNLAGHVASLFHATGCGGSYFGNKTMLEVLHMHGQGGYAELGAYVTTAVLNAAAGKTPVLSVPTCLNLWNECANRGYYEATAGVHWTPAQVVTYIKSTIPG